MSCHGKLGKKSIFKFTNLANYSKIGILCLQGIVNISILVYGSTLVWGKTGKKCLDDDDLENYFMYYFAFILLVLGMYSLFFLIFPN